MNRLIFVNRFYWPDEPATSQLLTDLAERLAARGFPVSVIASKPVAPATPARETRGGVEIRRVGSSRLDRRHAFARCLDYVSFMLGAGWRLLATARKGDVIIFMTDPPMLAAMACPWLAFRGIRFLHWIQDVYPEIATELTGQRWLQLLRPGRNLVWRQAVACIVLGKDMARIVARAGVPADRIKLMPNWAPAGLQPPAESDIEQLKRAWQLTGRFVALYSGNLGRVHDLQPVIDLATRLHSERDMVFVFIGHGAQLPALQASVRDRGLTNVRFFPPQPRERLALTLGLGDVHFVTLRPGCEGWVFPSKLYGIAAVGRPLLFIGPQNSDFSQQVMQAGLGLSFSRNDPEALALALRALRDDPARRHQHGRAARRFALAHDVDQAVVAWVRLLQPDSNLAALASPVQPAS